MTEAIPEGEMDFNVPQYNLDHTRPIVGYGNFTKKQQDPDARSMVDPTIVKQKFDMLNEAIKRGYFNADYKGPRINKLKAISMLKDKAIRCFYNFKFNRQPFKLRFYQDVLLSDNYDRILFASSNQIGKSLALDGDAAIEFSRDHKHEWVGILVSKSIKQSQYQMRRIKQLLKSNGFTSYTEEQTISKKTGKADNTTELTYTFYDKDGKTPLYTNVLICCPPTGSALGYPCNRMWLDEFDWWENIDQNHFMQHIAIPRTIDTEGAIIVFTNPNGKERELFKLWNETYEDGSHVWHRYNFNYWDKPGATQAKFDKLTSGMTRNQIDSTMLALFSQMAGAFLSHDEIHDQISEELCEKKDAAGYGRETAWFLDVGSVHDQSSLIGGYVEPNEKNPDFPLINAFYVHKYPVGYPIARVVGVKETVDDEGNLIPLDILEDGWEDDVKDNPSVKDVLYDYAEHEYGEGEEINKEEIMLPLFGCDVTGNAGISPLFQAAGIDPVDITFSGKKKWYMYQRYQFYTQQRWFRRAEDRDFNAIKRSDFTYQAGKLVVKKGTKTSYKQIHHENENDLDDTQDAVVGMIYLIENPDLPSLSFDIIPFNGKESDDDKKPNEKPKVAKDQYIPSFYNPDELNGWIEKREAQRT